MSSTNLMARRALGVLSLVALASCAVDKELQLEREASANSGAEAAQVSVDIVSINHWQDVQSHFLSNYGVTGKSALSLVNQAAAFENAGVLNSTSFGAGIEFDGNILSKDSSKSSQTTTSAGTAATSASNVSSSDVKQQTPAAATPPPAASGPSASVPAFAASQVPTLAPGTALSASEGYFRSANALDLGYGSIAPCGFVPILMTFRISIIPQKRNLPYDTYLDLSLAPSSQAAPRRTALAESNLRNSLVHLDSQVFFSQPIARAQTALAVSADVAASAASDPAAYKKLEDDPLRCGHKIDPSDIRLVSFASDSLENTQSDVTAQQTKALLLGAAIRAGQVGGSADFQKLSQRIDAVLALHPNSLLSVSRRGASTLHVRLGANRFGPEQYEMLPLEHNVSTLLLVPYQLIGSQVRAIGSYYFVNVHGAAASAPMPGLASDTLPVQAPDWTAKRMLAMRSAETDVRAEFGQDALPASIDDIGLLKLMRSVRTNDFPGFRELLKVPQDAADSSDPLLAAQMLWARFLGVAWLPGVIDASAELPNTTRVCPAADGKILVKDDGTSAIAQVRGGDGWAGQHITAELWFKLKSADDPTIRLAAIDIGGQDVGDLVFQSVSDVVKPADVDWTQSGLSFKARDKTTWCPNVQGSPATTSYGIQYVVAPKDDKKLDKTAAPAGVTAYPTQVAPLAATTGGSFRVTINLEDLKADSVLVSVTAGGQLDGATSTAPGSALIAATAGKVPITASGDYNVNLTNLGGGKPVSVLFEFQLAKKTVGTRTIKLTTPKTS